MSTLAYEGMFFFLSLSRLYIYFYLLMANLTHSPHHVAVIFCYNLHYLLSTYILYDNLTPLYSDIFAIYWDNIQYMMIIIPIACQSIT